MDAGASCSRCTNEPGRGQKHGGVPFTCWLQSAWQAP